MLSSSPWNPWNQIPRLRVRNFTRPTPGACAFCVWGDLLKKNLTENETTKETAHKLIDTEHYTYINMLIHSCSKCKIFPSLWTTNWKNTRAWVLWHCDLGVVRLNGNITRLCFTRSFLTNTNVTRKLWTYPSSNVSCHKAITPGIFLGLALQLSGTYQTFERFFCPKGGSFSKDMSSMLYFPWKQRNPWRLHQGKYLMNRNSTFCRYNVVTSKKNAWNL